MRIIFIIVVLFACRAVNAQAKDFSQYAIDEPKPDYATAYHASQKSGKPLIILLSAKWCSPCHIMAERLDAMKVPYVHVDVDKDSFAGQMMTGNSIPQLVVYRRVGKNWKRSSLTGPKPEHEIREFLEQ